MPTVMANSDKWIIHSYIDEQALRLLSAVKEAA